MYPSQVILNGIKILFLTCHRSLLTSKRKKEDEGPEMRLELIFQYFKRLTANRSSSGMSFGRLSCSLGRFISNQICCLLSTCLFRKKAKNGRRRRKTSKSTPSFSVLCDCSCYYFVRFEHFSNHLLLINLKSISSRRK